MTTNPDNPVCEHNHTVRHVYSHIPQGYDECSLCGATRVEGEDWRTPTPAATEGERWDEWNVEPLLKEIVGTNLNGRYDCPHPDFDTVCVWFAEWLNKVGFQPTETEVTG
jgi:hypothetical protein